MCVFSISKLFDNRRTFLLASLIAYMVYGMKKIAILGASYAQLPLIIKAKQMGFETHVFAWETGDVGENAADFFHPISIREKELVLNKCTEVGIDSICSIVSDVASVTVSYVAEKMGLPGNSLECAIRSTNKQRMRRCFGAHGDPCPESRAIDHISEIEDLVLDYPVIVKPVDRSGSRGIFKVYDKEELVSAVEQSLEVSFEHRILVEDFAEGDEYSVEFISYQGQHHFLQITQKHTTGEPYFLETGHTEPAPLVDELRDRIKNVISHALTSLGITDGASHSEVKVDAEGNINIIEIGPRMGGGGIGTDLVHLSTGVDFVRAVIDVANGNIPDLIPEFLGKRVESRYILTSEDYRKYSELLATNPEAIIKLHYLNPSIIDHVFDSPDRKQAGLYIVDLARME